MHMPILDFVKPNMCSFIYTWDTVNKMAPSSKHMFIPKLVLIRHLSEATGSHGEMVHNENVCDFQYTRSKSYKLSHAVAILVYWIIKASLPRDVGKSV